MTDWSSLLSTAHDHLKAGEAALMDRNFELANEEFAKAQAALFEVRMWVIAHK